MKSVSGRKILMLFGFFLLFLGSNPVWATVIDVGSQVSSYIGYTRGFWFTAPTDFTITGLGLPTDQSTQNFDVAVLRLNAAPATYPSNTTNFSTLFISRDNSGSGLLSTDIAVNSGDIIGILGSRGSNAIDSYNSYGPDNYMSNILGNTVTLSRLLMQSSLRSTDPSAIGVSTEDYDIGRVLVDIAAGNAAAVPEPSTIFLLGLGLLGLAGIARKKIIS